MGVKDLLQRIAEKKRRVKEIEHQMRIQKQAEDRLKTSEERELEKFLEERRQKQIKRNVDTFRKQKTQEFLRGENIFKHKNIFANQQSIMTEPTMLTFKKNKLSHRNTFFK